MDTTAILFMLLAVSASVGASASAICARLDRIAALLEKRSPT